MGMGSPVREDVRETMVSTMLESALIWQTKQELGGDKEVPRNTLEERDAEERR